MNYNPKDAISCLPEGQYEATIEKAEESVSKAGKDMVVLTFKVYSERGNYMLREYIVASTLYKLKKVAQAIGQEAAFESGEFNPADYVGRNLLLDLEVEEDPNFGDKNKIKRCVKLDRAMTKPVTVPDNPPDGDIPF